MIRKAKLKDLNIIVKLFDEFMKEHDRIILKVDPKIKPHLSRNKGAKLDFKNFMRKNIKSKNALVLIAEVDKNVAGYCLAKIVDNISIFTIEKLGHINDIYVKKQYQGLKISSKFKNTIMQWLKKRKIKYSSLQVNIQNKHAHSIYKKWGYKDFKMEMRKKI